MPEKTPAPNEPASAPIRQEVDEPPPFLGSWPRVYAATLIFLVVVIVLLFLFTRAFAP